MVLADFLWYSDLTPLPLGEVYRHPQDVPEDDRPLSSRMELRSKRYNEKRSTLVKAELLLLRVLGFDLRLVSPFDYVSQYLHRALQGIWAYCEELDDNSELRRENCGVAAARMMASRPGMDVRARVVEACRNMRGEITVPAKSWLSGVSGLSLRSAGCYMERWSAGLGFIESVAGRWP